MVLTGGAVIPHGPIAFDGDPNSESAACRQRHSRLDPKLAPKFTKLYKGCCEAAKQVADMDPEVIVMHTSHGVTLSQSTGVYFNDTTSGSCEWLGHWTEFKVEVTCPTDMALGMVDHLKANNYPSEGVTLYSNINVRVLRWGEAIPIWYITRALGEKANNVKYIFLSLPYPETSPHPFSNTMQEGGVLYEYLEKRKERIVFIASGDISHVYETNCTDPLYLPNPRSPVSLNDGMATAFEDAVKSWALAHQESALNTVVWDPVKAEPFLQKCNDLQSEAVSCGLGGFILLHGLMKASIKTGGSIFSPTMTACEAPSYYGMMAVVFKQITT